MTLRVFCFLLLWTVILNWRFSVTEFAGWWLCLIVFKTFSDSGGIRTHAHIRVSEFLTEDFLEPAAFDRSSILPGFRRHIFSFCSVSFQLIDIFNSEMWSAKLFVSSIWKDLHLNPSVESYFPCLRRVSSFLCTFKLLGYQPPNDVASLLFSFALDCHLELTFQYDRICQLKALPHRVQNVFWQEWDSNSRTNLCTWCLDWGNSAVWCVRQLSFSCLRFVGHYAFDLRDFLLEFFDFRDVIGCTVIVIHFERFAWTDVRLNVHEF